MVDLLFTLWALFTDPFGWGTLSPILFALGGGGTSSRTTTSSEFPPEFRPLAESAVRQLMDLQTHLPISSFAEYEPAGTAGIAPMQQFAMDQLIPSTFMTTPAQQGVFNTQAPINAASSSVAGAGGPTNAAQSALNALSSSGRLGSGAVSLPGGSDMAAFGMNLPPVQAPPTIFPGMSMESLMQGWPQASRGSVPVLGGPGPQYINPGQPTPEGFFPPPFDTHVDQDMIWFTSQLTGRERNLFNSLIDGGMSIEEAFNRARGQHVRLGEQGNQRGNGPPAPPPPITPPPPVDGSR